MENITSTTGLKKAIELLEADQAVKLERLKQEFYPVYDSLKPVNLFRSTLNDITSSPYLIDNIIGTMLGLVTGYLSKKMIVGTSVNRVRKLFGAILQFGVTNVVARHAGMIKSYGRQFIQHIFNKSGPLTH